MANIRREFGDDLTLKNGNLGINTITAQERVDVVGVVKGQDLYASGVSSLTAYEGFLRADNQIVESTTLEFGNGLKASLSGEIIVGTGVTVTIGIVGLGTAEVGVGSTSDANGKTASNIDTTDINLAGGSQVECLKVFNTFTPPSGGTNERPYKPKPGQLYYNYDLKTIEFHDGYGWRQVDNTTRSGRGVIMGGRQYPAPDTAGAAIANISYIQISTRGNVQDFGSLENGGPRESAACLGSSTRSIKGGGTAESPGEEQNDIQYITTASQGNAIDFGDLNNRVRSHGAVSSSTRGLFAGGCVHPNTDTDSIDYIEMSTLGDAIDFGDHVAGRNIQGIGSPTKAVFGDGNGSTTLRSINIASKGNTTFFGDVFQVTSGSGTVGNSVRGIFCGGYNISPTGSSVINYITFASNGNGTDFGEMNGLHQTASSGGMSSATKGVFGPGQSPFTGTNNVAHYLDEITFSTSGSATDFGDSGIHGNFNPKVSDSHGGLGGF